MRYMFRVFCILLSLCSLGSVLGGAADSASTASNLAGISSFGANITNIIDAVQIIPDTIILAAAETNDFGVVTKHSIWIGTSSNLTNEWNFRAVPLQSVFLIPSFSQTQYNPSKRASNLSYLLFDTNLSAVFVFDDTGMLRKINATGEIEDVASCSDASQIIRSEDSNGKYQYEIIDSILTQSTLIYTSAFGDLVSISTLNGSRSILASNLTSYTSISILSTPLESPEAQGTEAAIVVAGNFSSPNSTSIIIIDGTRLDIHDVNATELSGFASSHGDQMTVLSFSYPPSVLFINRTSTVNTTVTFLSLQINCHPRILGALKNFAILLCGDSLYELNYENMSLNEFFNLSNASPSLKFDLTRFEFFPSVDRFSVWDQDVLLLFKIDDISSSITFETSFNVSIPSSSTPTQISDSSSTLVLFPCSNSTIQSCSYDVCLLNMSLDALEPPNLIRPKVPQISSSWTPIVGNGSHSPIPLSNFWIFASSAANLSVFYNAKHENGTNYIYFWDLNSLNTSLSGDFSTPSSPATFCPIAKPCSVGSCGPWNYSTNACSEIPCNSVPTPRQSPPPSRLDSLGPIFAPYFRRPRIPAANIPPPIANVAHPAASDDFPCGTCFAVFFNSTGFSECKPDFGAICTPPTGSTSAFGCYRCDESGQCVGRCEETQQSAVLSPGVTFAICLGAIAAFIVWVVLFGTCLKKNQERWALARRSMEMQSTIAAATPSNAEAERAEEIYFEPAETIVWPKARCAVCMDSPPDSLCDPCGHMFCSTCFGKLEGWCALCRGEIHYRIVLQGLEAEQGSPSAAFGVERCVSCAEIAEMRSALNPCGHLLCSQCTEATKLPLECPACKEIAEHLATIHWAAMEASEAAEHEPIVHNESIKDDYDDNEAEFDDEDDAAGSSD